jgi:hypothetical protein
LLAYVSDDVSAIERATLEKLAKRLGIEAAQVDVAVAEAKAMFDATG